MEILILTGKFGMGHWSAALSIQEQLEREGFSVIFEGFQPQLHTPVWAQKSA